MIKLGAVIIAATATLIAVAAVRATAEPVTGPTPTPTPSVCVGDCNGDGAVTVNELVTGVNIALGAADVSACPALQCPSGPVLGVFVDCVVDAVHNLLSGCPTLVPTPAPTPT
jgi:hypothetical protein